MQNGVVADMLGVLDLLGLIGLGVATDQLRTPAAVARPLLTPEEVFHCQHPAHQTVGVSTP